ncbi:MAG: putative rRNA maturation factor [Ascidiaceihabitans sp.]
METIAETAVNAVLTRLGIDGEDVEVAVLACNDTRIAELNADFREKPTATNVLSWPAAELGSQIDGGPPDTPIPDYTGAMELGDIAISYDTCVAEATAAGKPAQDHVMHLMIHGTLHLLGYDHIRDEDATLMETLEVEILENMGLDDPYYSPRAD